MWQKDKSTIFEQSLLQHDHLNKDDYGTISIIKNNPATRRRQQVDYSINPSRYQPPENFDSEQFQDNPYQTSTCALFHNTPKTPSFTRAILPQTPSRTVVINSTTNVENLTHPSQDLAENSLFSYGLCCIQCVRTTEIGVVENCGRFQSIVGPGLHLLLWPFSDISGRLSLRIQQLEVVCESKTLDSVFCHIVVFVSFRIIYEKSYDAYYRLTNPQNLMEAYVYDTVRSEIPKMTLDQLFEAKTKIAKIIHNDLGEKMNDYGYEIVKALVIDIRPDPLVVASMNEIYASRQLKIAIAHKAEADKFSIIKNAEANTEAAYFSGVGIARQRSALSQGMKESLSQLQGSEESNKDVMNILLMTQYMDMITAISSVNHQNSNSMLINSTPDSVWDLRRQIASLKEN